MHKSMAKSQPQHRGIVIAPASDVSTIHEVDEERETVNAQLRSSTNKLSDNLGLQPALPGQVFSVHLEDIEDNSNHQTDGPRIDQLIDNSKVIAAQHRTGLSESKQEEQESHYPYTAVHLHNEMEHDLLLDRRTTQCNGGVSVPINNRADELGYEYHPERRATVASGAVGHLDVAHIPTHRNKVPTKTVPGLTYNRSLSLSGEGKRFHGSNKDMRPINITVGSMEHITRPSSNSGYHGDSNQGSPHPPKLDAESKNQPKYGSTLSNIGVEYMRAAGAMGVRFKQLQKPHTSQESLNSNGHEEGDKKGAGVTSLVSELPLIIPMNRTIPVKSESRLAALKNHDKHHHHHHVGYKLGHRKTLAERRRKLADYGCLFALIGLSLMVIEMECTIAKAYQKVGYKVYL